MPAVGVTAPSGRRDLAATFGGRDDASEPERLTLGQAFADIRARLILVLLLFLVYMQYCILL